MEFRLLGPLEVSRSGALVAVGGPRQQLVLAALLLRANETASIAYLVDSVWDLPPASPETNLRTYVAGLRRRLDAPAGQGSRLVTVGGGYRLLVYPGEFDVTSFDEQVAAARAAAAQGDLARAADAFDQALHLWRGEPLEGCRPGPTLRAELDQLVERRMSVVAEQVTCRLDLGEHGAVVEDLRRLVARHPLREELWAALMLALHRSGRRADALDAYLQASKHLAQEAGIDPGQRLRDLHAAVLHDDPALAAHPAKETVPAAPRPAQLPASTSHFTGRAGELDHLVNRWSCGDRAPSALVVAAVGGMAGIGKTALAVHAAHLLAARFADGVLFCDLRGFTPDTEPTSPGTALEYLLRGLGVPGRQIPPGVDARAALYRTVLAGRRVLVVLDNAADEAQVRPLLPGSAGCLVLVTSRRRLTGLDDADHLTLDTLPAAEAIALFTRVAGDRVASADPGTIEQIVDLCGRLPLAVRIAAARLRTSRAMTAGTLLGQLSSPTTAETLAVLEDGERSVATTFAVSYHHLTGEQQKAFRRLGLHPGPDLEPYAAAALLDVTVARARGLLEDLAQANLLDQPAPGRHRFHDLVRAHAEHTARCDDTHTDRRAALSRLFDHYAHTASVAMDAVYPHEVDQRPRFEPATTAAPDVDGTVAAEAWLDTEHDNLLAAARHAADGGWPTHALHLSATLGRHLLTRGRYSSAAGLHRHALNVAVATGDRAGEVGARNAMGQVHRLQGRHDESTYEYQQALSVAVAIGDRRGEVSALNGLGHLHKVRSQHEQATDLFEQALALARAVGDRSGEVVALDGIASVHQLQGRYRQAAEYFEQVLTLARTLGDRTGEQVALDGIGTVHHLQGQYQQAAERFEQILVLARATGHRTNELNALLGLGYVHKAQRRHQQSADYFEQALVLARATGYLQGQLSALYGTGCIHQAEGRPDQATGCHEQALQIARDVGNRNWEFENLHSLGAIHHAARRHRQAITAFQAALRVASTLNQPTDHARALDSLARAYRATGHHRQAREHWQQALDILTAAGTDHTEDPQTSTRTIRDHLATLNP